MTRTAARARRGGFTRGVFAPSTRAHERERKRVSVTHVSIDFEISQVSEEMSAFIKNLRSKITIGVVGGSDFPKQKEQLGETVVHDFDFAFSENGLVAYKAGAALPRLRERFGIPLVFESVS